MTLRVHEGGIVYLSVLRTLFYGTGCPVRLKSLFISSHCSAVIIMSPSNASTPFPIYEQNEALISRSYFSFDFPDHQV